MIPTRDDLELTLSELKSQRLQWTLSLILAEAGIEEVLKMLKKLPKKKEPQENQYNDPGEDKNPAL